MKGHKHLTIVIKLGMQGIGPVIIQLLITPPFPGSSSIVHEKTHEPLLSVLSLIVETAVALIKDGHRVVIVSSGAIAVGLRRMQVEKRPKYLPRIQVHTSLNIPAKRSSMLIFIQGLCSGRTVSAYEPLGKPVCPSTAACRANPPDEERHS